MRRQPRHGERALQSPHVCCPPSRCLSSSIVTWWPSPCGQVDGEPTGAVRASFGWCSTISDADALVAFLAHSFADAAPALDNALAQAVAAAKPRSRHQEESSTVPRRRPIDADVNRAAPGPITVQELFVYPVKSCESQLLHWMFCAPGLCLTLLASNDGNSFRWGA